nr:MAG TPA: putative nucleic-acid-binding protein [Caudoviricetes sp.]
MSDLEVSKMNFKQLRNEVFELRDELAKFKRLFADSIENLDNDNFSSHILKEKEHMKTEISVSADGIKTLVVKTDNLESGMTEMSSTIEQTAEKIETKVSKDELDGEIKKSSVITQLSDSIKTKVEKEDLTKELSKYSTIEQTEDSITSAVTEVNNDLKEAFESSIEQTKNSISMIVKANYGSPLEVTVFNKNTADTGVVYYESSTNLYWHYDGEKWQSGANGNFGSVFKQTANGFELDGKVKISGDLITDGTISADRIDTDNLFCTKLYSPEGEYYAKVWSRTGDFGLYSPFAARNATPIDSTCIWGVYNNVDAVNFYINGVNYLGYNLNVNKVYPKGEWDFSSCTVTNLNGGGSGGVAVFG